MHCDNCGHLETENITLRYDRDLLASAVIRLEGELSEARGERDSALLQVGVMREFVDFVRHHHTNVEREAHANPISSRMWLAVISAFTETPKEEPHKFRAHRDGKTCLCDFDKNVCPLHGVGTEKRIQDPPKNA